MTTYFINSTFDDSIITPDVVQELEYYNDLAPNQDDIVKHHASDIQIVSLLGKGSYCDVSLVISRSTKEQLAMKRLDRTKIASSDDFLAAAPDLVIEAHYLAKFNHPNIIKLRGTSAQKFSESYYSEDKEGYFLTMEVMEETLKDRLRRWRNDPSCYKRRKRIFNPLKAKKVDAQRMYGRLETAALGIAKAMDYLHQQDVILRDLKPENVGFHSETGKVCLLDFGFARDLNICSPNEISGTPRYIAPEVLRGEGYSSKSDVYSFGVLLHELASLDKRKGSNNASIENHQNLLEVRNTLPELSLSAIPCKDVISLIEVCLSQSPETRPSFENIVETLSEILNGRVSASSVDSKPLAISKTDDAPYPIEQSVFTGKSNSTLETLPDSDLDASLCDSRNAAW